MSKKAALHNLGCKVNSYELDAVAQMLEEDGYELVPFAPGADLYVINTCTVTNIADRKSRQMLHRAKRMNPSAVVVAMGCYAQIKGEELKTDTAIDMVIGNNQHTELLQMLRSFEERKDRNLPAEDAKQTAWIDINKECEYEAISISRSSEHTRAFIKVQDGCNQFCSYCIIPYARGRVRSRSIADTVNEATRMALNGVKEIVLTGIHLCSYGSDFQDGTTLVDLLEAVHEIPDIRRIRLGSLEPASITEEMAKRMGRLGKLCPHFHLSLQSGCDSVLGRMNRGYTSSEYEEICKRLRTYFEDPALTTDIIVGFPGESDAEFEEGAAFVERIGFAETHIFPYSKREGTRAARMEMQLTEAVKKERAHRLHVLDQRKKQEFLNGLIGRTQNVLIEEKKQMPDGNFYWVGYTQRYQKALIEVKNPKEDCSGRIVPICPSEVVFGEYFR